LETRRDAILTGAETDPYLLILSPQRDVSAYYRAAGDRLLEIVAEWRLETEGPGPDYFRVLTYLTYARYPDANLACRKVLFHEGVADEVAHALLGAALAGETSLNERGGQEIERARSVAAHVRSTIESTLGAQDKADRLAELIVVDDVRSLSSDLERQPIELQDSSSSDEEEIWTAGAISPVDLMTMIGAKGLSADHVIVIGFDDVNMAPISPQLFFVAMTRARHSLHLVTSLRARGASLPHQFLRHLPPAHCRYSKRTARTTTDLGDLDAYLGWFDSIIAARSKASRR
jgi:hypothetical protein